MATTVLAIDSRRVACTWPQSTFSKLKRTRARSLLRRARTPVVRRAIARSFLIGLPVARQRAPHEEQRECERGTPIRRLSCQGRLWAVLNSRVPVFVGLPGGRCVLRWLSGSSYSDDIDLAHVLSSLRCVKQVPARRKQPGGPPRSRPKPPTHASRAFDSHLMRTSYSALGTGPRRSERCSSRSEAESGIAAFPMPRSWVALLHAVNCPGAAITQMP